MSISWSLTLMIIIPFYHPSFRIFMFPIVRTNYLFKLPLKEHVEIITGVLETDNYFLQCANTPY